MTTATFVLAALAMGLFFYAWRRGDGSHRRGAEQGWQILRRTLPNLIIAFVIVGYINVLAPQKLIQAQDGED